MIAAIFVCVVLLVYCIWMYRHAIEQAMLTHIERYAHVANWSLLVAYVSAIVLIILIAVLLWRYLP